MTYVWTAEDNRALTKAIENTKATVRLACKEAIARNNNLKVNILKGDF